MMSERAMGIMAPQTQPSERPRIPSSDAPPSGSGKFRKFGIRKVAADIGVDIDHFMEKEKVAVSPWKLKLPKVSPKAQAKAPALQAKLKANVAGKPAPPTARPARDPGLGGVQPRWQSPRPTAPAAPKLPGPPTPKPPPMAKPAPTPKATPTPAPQPSPGKPSEPPKPPKVDKGAKVPFTERHRAAVGGVETADPEFQKILKATQTPWEKFFTGTTGGIGLTTAGFMAPMMAAGVLAPESEMAQLGAFMAAGPITAAMQGRFAGGMQRAKSHYLAGGSAATVARPKSSILGHKPLQKAGSFHVLG